MQVTLKRGKCFVSSSLIYKKTCKYNLHVIIIKDSGVTFLGIWGNPVLCFVELSDRRSSFDWFRKNSISFLTNQMLLFSQVLISLHPDRAGASNLNTPWQDPSKCNEACGSSTKARIAKRNLTDGFCNKIWSKADQYVIFSWNNISAS